MNQLGLAACIRDQPQSEYRFRFPTEKARSILYSRSAPQSESRFPTACLLADAAALPYVQGTVTVTVSTVNDEGLIHPYYLVGRGCEKGVFKAEMQFPNPNLQLPGGKIGIIVELENVAIFCVKRDRDILQQAIQERIRTGVIPFFHQRTHAAADVYSEQIALLDSTRLAFAFYHHGTNQNATVFSEPISKAPRVRTGNAKPLLMPAELPLVPVQTVWLHIDGLARGARFTFQLTAQPGSDSIAEIECSALRANLLQLQLKLKPEATLPQPERIQCELRISDGVHEHSADVFLLKRNCPQCLQDMAPVEAAMQMGVGAAVYHADWVGLPDVPPLDSLDAFMEEIGLINGFDGN